MTMDEIATVMERGVQASGFSDRLTFDCGEDGVIHLSGAGTSREQAEADCTIRISAENLSKLVSGKLNPMTGLAMGKLKVSGNPAVAMKLAGLLKG